MLELLCDHFQQVVGDSLARRRSILDNLSRLQESTARLQRTVTHAVTACGCVRVEASKQTVPADAPLRELAQHLSTHVAGQLCEQCRERLEEETGATLFYLTALLDTLDLSLLDCLIKEQRRVVGLGPYHCL